MEPGKAVNNLNYATEFKFPAYLLRVDSLFIQACFKMKVFKKTSSD